MEAVKPVRGVMKVIVGPDKTVVAGGFHPSCDSICFPGTPARVAGRDQLDVPWEEFSVRNRVFFAIVDDEQFIFGSQLCGDLVTGVSPRSRREEYACWCPSLCVRHPYSKRERGYGW
jgi:hypothetical protein